MPTKKVLFCTDFSDNSLPARDLAIEFATAFDAELHILHVISAHFRTYPVYETMVPVDVELLEEQIQEGAKNQLEIIAEECRKQVREVNTGFATGTPAVEIVRYAEEESIDLIVMGTHGWTGFKHLVLGSTAENVVRSASCPVLTVRSRVSQ
jgi:universal stress protein A